MVTHTDDLFNTKDSYLQLLPEDVKNHVARCVTHEQHLNEKIISDLNLQICCNKYEVVDKIPTEFIDRSPNVDPSFRLHYKEGKAYLDFTFNSINDFKDIPFPTIRPYQTIKAVELAVNNNILLIFSSYQYVDAEKTYVTYIYDSRYKKLFSFDDTVDAIVSDDGTLAVTVAHQPHSNSIFFIRDLKTGLINASLKLPNKVPPFDTVELFFDKEGKNIGLEATTITRTNLFFRWNITELAEKKEKLKLLTPRDQALLLSYLIKIKKDPTAASDAEIDTFVKPLDAKIKEGSSLISKAIKDMTANMGRVLNLQENTQLSKFVASDTEASP